MKTMRFRLLPGAVALLWCATLAAWPALADGVAAAGEPGDAMEQVDAGDEVIRLVGHTIQDSLRPGDFAARYGGEEFTVIMPLTTLDGMRTVAERIRTNVSAARCEWEGETLNLTISLGCAALEQAQSQLDGERLLENADKKLYEAKEGGRNRVEL